MIQAITLTERNALEFSKVFAYQYLISKTQMDLTGFDHIELGRRHLYVGQKLHRCEVRDRNDTLIGFVLGIAVDDHGLLSGRRDLTIDAQDPQVFDDFHRYLTQVAGRYVFVLSIENEERVYTDPVAMIGCVYNYEAGLVGSSLNLVLDREVELNPLFDHHAVTREDGKYTLFQTRDAHVRRLNGSFFLDLANYTETRFWPRAADIERSVGDYGANYDEIIKHAHHSLAKWRLISRPRCL